MSEGFCVQVGFGFRVSGLGFGFSAQTRTRVTWRRARQHGAGANPSIMSVRVHSPLSPHILRKRARRGVLTAAALPGEGEVLGITRDEVTVWRVNARTLDALVPALLGLRLAKHVAVL